jgi:hypothetical protein
VKKEGKKPSLKWMEFFSGTEFQDAIQESQKPISKTT